MIPASHLSTLSSIGLSDNESRVYLALLSLGSATVLKIARASGIKRTTVYSVIDSLIHKGLVYKEVKGFKNFYTSEDPHVLERLLDERRRELKDILPEFSALYNFHEKESSIRYYASLEGIKNIYEQILSKLTSGDPYYVIARQQKWYTLDTEWFEDFLERRAKLALDTRLLFEDTQEALHHKKFERNYNQQVKILPPGISFSSDIIVCPYAFVMHELVPPFSAVVIENRHIINTQLELFRYLWDSTQS